ncbi:hypothetical protein NA57DRAFT_81955 [Rhizodiscina lignyota]|uniref:Uncharacterized protein n=1 Tax=Rhizodiscina lignyota TaxID=1504668 RepID=A0A9P4I669_9PEZI|nr:hypothetical protein NA57DRAFT_81955 [Rhizodiscina lignyota]
MAPDTPPQLEADGVNPLNLLVCDPNIPAHNFNWWQKFNWVRLSLPRDFNDVILRKDGYESGSSVTIYRSSHDGAHVLDPTTRTVYDPRAPSGHDPVFDEWIAQSFLDRTVDDGCEKQVLFLAKCGPNIDITEDSESVSLDENPVRHPSDIRTWTGNQRWPEVRRTFHAVPDVRYGPTLRTIAGTEEKVAEAYRRIDERREQNKGVKVDAYEDVDEWTQDWMEHCSFQGFHGIPEWVFSYGDDAWKVLIS